MPSEQTIKRDLLLEPPDPMRASMDEELLHELAHSMRDVGQLSPLLVTPSFWRTPDGVMHVSLDTMEQSGPGERMYEIIDGHRRYLASALVGITELRCTVFDNVEDAKFAMMVHANLMREDVTPAEEGLQYLTLAERYNWGIEQLCRTFRRSESYINDRVDLVRGDSEVTAAVAARKINFGVAKVINRCADEAHRRYLLQLAQTHGANIRTAESWLADWKRNVDLGNTAPPAPVAGAWQPPPPPPLPVCTWCLKDNHQEHMVDAKFHRWHFEELLECLQNIGIHKQESSTSQEKPASVPSA